MNGGYALIDCTGLDLSNLGTVPGIYDSVKAAVTSDKVIVLVGIVNDEQAFSPITAYGGIEESGVFVSFLPVTLQITDEDLISIYKGIANEN